MPRSPRAKNVIFLLGDGMGMAHRTAARIVSRGVARRQAESPLAMDTLEVTGLVMTSSLNAAITDSAPGMSSYSTGHKANNNQEGVYPDNTPDPFDNPRVEYIGELLRRVRGAGFNVGIVTTADVTDATPAANAVHTADRNAGPASPRASSTNARATASRCCWAAGAATSRRQARPAARAAKATTRSGRRVRGCRLSTSCDRQRRRGAADGAGAPPAKLLGLFHPPHMPVAFDKRRRRAIQRRAGAAEERGAARSADARRA